jgi:superfamily II DNA/RNA helicase
MLDILREYRGYKILIFCNTKHKTNELCDIIRTRMRQRAYYIHGDVPQERRELYVS